MTRTAVLPDTPLDRHPPDRHPVESTRPRGPLAPRSVNEELADCFRHPDVAEELFLPIEFATWKDDRYLLKRGAARTARSRISGVRLQEWDRTGANPSREQQCQSDVRRLVHSIRAMRARASLRHAIVSRDTMRSTSSLEPHVRRVKFGVRAPADERFAEDTAAAKESHRAIVTSIRRAGFVIEQPKGFDAATGLAGLEQWASALRLRKRWRPKPWWLLLLPLLLLPLALQKCHVDHDFFGLPIETQSFLLVVDRSSSMAPHLQAVQGELRRTLQEMRAADGTRYLDVIAYAADAESALGGLKPLDDQVAADLTHYIDALATQGGTNLESAIRKAGEEVSAHGKPTTLIILTDGEDESIPGMLQHMPDVQKLFGEIRVNGNATTPRLFGGGDATPANAPEHNLNRFAEAMHGRFGSARTKP